MAPRSFLSFSASLALALAACGGAAAPSAPAASSPAASKPAAASAPTSAAASAAASASAKPAASGAAASGSAAPKPTATFVPRVQAETSVAPLTKTVIPGTEGKAVQADIIDIDQEGHLMVVGDSTSVGVDVWDISAPAPKFLRTLKTPTGPSGVSIAKNVGRIVAALADSSVVSIDMSSNQIVGTINTGGKKRADELDYDSKDKKVYVANSDDGIITSIDMTSFKVARKFENMGNLIEQPRYDAADGMMYVTIRDPDQLAQFDPAKDELVKTFDLPKGFRAAGIWMNPKTNMGVIAGRPSPIIWDFKAGKMAGTLEQMPTPDEIHYSPKLDVYVGGANSAPWGPTVGIVGGTPIKFITNVPGVEGGHQAGIDDTNNVVYTMGRDGLYSFPLPPKALGGGAASTGPAAKPAASAKPPA
jgi:hypothetical protein